MYGLNIGCVKMNKSGIKYHPIIPFISRDVKSAKFRKEISKLRRSADRTINQQMLSFFFRLRIYLAIGEYYSIQCKVISVHS